MSPRIQYAIESAASLLASAYALEAQEKNGQPREIYGIEHKGGDFARVSIDLAPLAFALAMAMQSGDAATVMGGGKELNIICK
jgi:hypothetical protein